MDEDWISITDAADRLTKAGDPVTRSSLSRYLDKHADALPTRRAGRSNLVDYIRLRRHRRENIRLEVPVSGPDEGGVVASAAFEPTKPFRSSGSDFTGTRVDGAARKVLADAELRELDLGQRRKELTPTAEVDRAGRDAIALMRNAFERATETEAAALSVKYGWDERLVRLSLKGFIAAGLDVFHREMLKRLDQFARVEIAGEDAGPEGDHVSRAGSDLMQ